MLVDRILALSAIRFIENVAKTTDPFPLRFHQRFFYLIGYLQDVGLIIELIVEHQPREPRLQGRSSPAVDVVALRNRRYVLTQINSVKKERLDVFSLLSHHYSRLSLLDHLICDVVGLGKPVIILSVGVYLPPDCAALLSRYPRIVSNLRVWLSKHQHLRRGRSCAR